MPSSGLGVDVLFIWVHGFCVGISVDSHVQRDQDVNRRGLCGSTQGFQLILYWGGDVFTKYEPRIVVGSKTEGFVVVTNWILNNKMTFCLERTFS